MIGNKIADNITSVSKKKPAMKLHSKELPNDNNDEDVVTPKKRYIPPKERQ